MAEVKFFPGDGTEYMLDVNYVAADYARGPDGTCAFCQGDPCAEYSAAGSRIAQYFERNRAWATSCPMCDGRPT